MMESLQLFQKPLPFSIAVSGDSGVHSLYFSVVDGSMAIVLLPPLELACSVAPLLDMSGSFRLELVLVIMTAPSSKSLLS